MGTVIMATSGAWSECRIGVMILISLLPATLLDIVYTIRIRPLGHNDAFFLSECSIRVQQGSIPEHTLEIYARSISDVFPKTVATPHLYE